MTLHDRIMCMCAPDNVVSHPLCMGGYHVAQQRAAEMAAEADELIQDLSAALSMYVRAGHGMSTDSCQQGDARQAALDALAKYNAYKEQSNG